MKLFDKIGVCPDCGINLATAVYAGHYVHCKVGKTRKEKPTLKVFRLRPDAKLPTRAHPTDAGLDLYYCPQSDGPGIWNRYESNSKNYVIYGGETGIIPTGIKVEVPPNHMLEIKNKSGVAAKKQLIIGACVVDCGYDGEVFVNLHNLARKKREIEPGEKIAQAVLIPIVTCEVEEVKEDVLNQDSSRGDGALGSTGEK